MTKKEKKPRSFLYTALPFFIMAHAGHHFLTALPQALLPFFQTEFNLTVATAAYVPMAFAIASATGQLPAGWFADKLGPAILIAIGTVGVAFGGVFVGFSQTFVMLLVGLVILGLLSGGYHPASTPLISASVKPEQRGRALGLHLVGGNSAFFIAPLIAAAIAGIWGWRGAFFTLAVPTAVFGIIFYIYLTRHAGKTHVENAKRQIIEDSPPQPGYKRRLIAFLTMTETGAVFAPIMGLIVDKYGFEKGYTQAGIAIVTVTLAASLFLRDSRG